MPTLKRFMTMAGALAWLLCGQALADTQTWSVEKANGWYAQHRWLVGSNYIPADAINQLEMWQADTFNPALINKELGWAAAAGMNTMRVYLHDQLWEQDARGFTQRIDQFLSIAAKHGIKTMLVLFDSCWDPNPILGKQREPKPGVHNSGWVQSPGRAGLADTANYPRLKSYVQGVIGVFAADERVLSWDLWNEPDNGLDAAGLVLINGLLPQVFDWARAANPSQPLTSGVWQNPDWSTLDKLTALERLQIERSDIITFHLYDWPEALERKILQLKNYGRPILCTEYLARSVGSVFDTQLPIALKHGVGMVNWGLVSGKTQTIYPWESVARPFAQPPIAWFHDVFHADGRPFRQAEVDLIRELTAAAQREFEQRGSKKKRRNP